MRTTANNRFIVGALTMVCALFLFATSGMATIIYEDTFSNTSSGTKLAGQSPETTYNSSVYQNGNSYLQYSGTGYCVANASGAAAVSLALPEITKGDVITLTLNVRVAGTAASTYIGLGFTSGVTTLSADNELMASLRADGQARVFQGSTLAADTLYNTSTVWAASTVSGSNYYNNAVETLVMTFDTGTNLLTYTINGATVYSAVINYTTYEDLNYITFQLASQNIYSTATPGYVDYLKVEVTSVPEPTAAALLMGSLGLLVFINRRRQLV